MHSAVCVRDSNIQGLGVFASRHFAAGEVILTIDDSYVVDADHLLPAGEEHHCDFLGGGTTVWMQLPERHINHCCDPNVYVRTTDGQRQVVAIRDIKIAEEIAYDYSINGYGDTVWNCHCGVDRCRQTIHSDFFHLPLQVQREYLPLLEEWYRKERQGELKILESWMD